MDRKALKMPRKPSIELPEEELTQLDNNEVSAKELGEKYEKPRSYFDNLKHKRKLKTSFKLNTADQNIQHTDNTKQQPELNQEMQLEHNIQPPIDYKGAVKGLYKGADSIFKLVAVMSKGQVEYTNVEDQKLDELAEITYNDHAVQKLATMGGVSTIVTVGAILGTFGGQFKIKKKIKHDENLAKINECKCDKCEKVRKIFEKAQKEEDIKEVVNVKQVETPKDKEIGKIEDSFNKIESALTEKPVVDRNGMIIEKNIPKTVLTESQVIEQNKGAVNNG
jgi:hypothetical protein